MILCKDLVLTSFTEHSGDIFKFGTAEPSFKRQVQAEDATSPTLASCSTHVDQDAKLGPALDKISASPPVVTLAASPRKTKKKPRRAAIPRCRLRERENQKNPKDGAVPGLQSVMAQPQGVGNQTNQEPNTEVSNHPTSPIVHPTPARCPPALPATLRSAPETSPSKSLDQKMEKRRSKKPAIQAEQCEGSSGDPANSSADDPAARRAMVLDMLARMAGGPASSADGAQGGGHRDFTFLLPPPAENRKCRLCRNMFTDKSNVKQADGGAPCSFHPGKYLSVEYICGSPRSLLILYYQTRRSRGQDRQQHDLCIQLLRRSTHHGWTQPCRHEFGVTWLHQVLSPGQEECLGFGDSEDERPRFVRGVNILSS